MEVPQHFTLKQVTESIQQVISKRYIKTYWVSAEIYKLNYTNKGHCFPELVQKENELIVAQLRGTIWKNNFEKIQQKFHQTVKEPLKDGLELLLLVKITFHPIYNIGLEILDIDPNYSLGAMQKERQETLERLQKEGVLNANQMLSMSLLPKRLAIISQSDSKGYSDFITLINAHPNKYKFTTFLFEATLQGDAAIESIRAQLRRIEKMKHLFDAVVIVRGGGGEIGMHCYNNYQLAKNIACFPLPILTGIGHSTNLTVCEMVAFHNGITPSDLAYYMLRIMEQLDSQLENSIIQLQHLCSQRFQTQKLQFERDVRKLSQDIHLTINQHQKNIIHLTHETSLLYREVVSRETNQLYNFHQQLQQHSNHYLMSLKTHQNNIITTISNEFSRTLEQTKNQIQQLNQHIENQLKNTFSFKKLQLESIEKSIELSDPQTILKRGFAIVSNKKGIISAINTVNSSDEIIIRTATQEIEAQVTNIKNI